MPNNFQEVADDVMDRVASWLRGASVSFVQTDGDTASYEEQVVFTCRKPHLKSGNICTANTYSGHHENNMAT